ncbi:YraN family protein [Flavobacterium sp.]|uniref:YraN family protein n=1 Tax=Flavobacterium sp. TaxID=239 RepID=UPI00261581BA|nr:YraN family protein [Flavobacterium sp.]
MAQHNDLGKKGEEMAVTYLEEQGYEILERNYVYQKSEIDIIARIGNVVCAVEVRTRSSVDFGLPEETVKSKKINNLLQAVNAYAEDLEDEVEFRFDIIAIVKNGESFDIKHLPDAFYHF